jgi:hypothetical protein
VTVVGHAATISAGEWITASGEWVNDRTHGQQLPQPRPRPVSPAGPQHMNANPESILKAASSAALLALAFDPRRNLHDDPAR